MRKLKLLITSLIVWCSFLGMADSKIVTCNMDPYNSLQENLYLLKPSNIDTTLCTHIKYNIVSNILSTGELDVIIKSIEIKPKTNYLKQIVDLKSNNKNLKIIAGLQFNATEYTTNLDTPTKRKHFVKSIMKLIRKYKFDGLDLHWKCPDNSEDCPQSKIIVKIMKKLSKKFKRKNYELSTSVYGTADRNNIPFNITKIVDKVDFINILAFDFGDVLNENAPLISIFTRNVKFVIKYWISQDIPNSKIVLGLPFYGKSLKLQTKSLKSGRFPYNYICHFEIKKKRRPYSFTESSIKTSNNIFVVYDDAINIKQKVEFGYCLGLAGFMVANLEYEDIYGECGVKNPLLTAIKNNLNNKPFHKLCEFMNE